MRKPILGITLGDPCGIGPEVLLKSISSREIQKNCLPLIIGDAQVLGLGKHKYPFKIHPILNPAQAQYKAGIINVLHIPNPEFNKLTLGIPSALSGKSSALAVEKSIELAQLNLIHGVVHGPISKIAWKSAGYPYHGQTEMISKLCNQKRVAMAILSEPLRTVLVTRHIPIKEVSQQLTQQKIFETISLSYEWLKLLLNRKPKIAVCALNPHAGESGTIGKEELKVLQPAIENARKKIDITIAGPLSADSAFRNHKEGLYDCLITQYHDQSLIPLKLFNADKLVNITIGLPFPRTSPGHGTAFDIAGKNCANPNPMIEAILWAAKLARQTGRIPTQ